MQGYKYSTEGGEGWRGCGDRERRHTVELGDGAECREGAECGADSGERGWGDGEGVDGRKERGCRE